MPGGIERVSRKVNYTSERNIEFVRVGVLFLD